MQFENCTIESYHIKRNWSGKVTAGESPSITLKIKLRGSKTCILALVRLVHFDMQPCVNWAQQMSRHKGASTAVFFPRRISPWSSQGLRSSRYLPGMTGGTVPAHPRALKAARFGHSNAGAKSSKQSLPQEQTESLWNPRWQQTTLVQAGLRDAAWQAGVEAQRVRQAR